MNLAPPTVFLAWRRQKETRKLFEERGDEPYSQKMS